MKDKLSSQYVVYCVLGITPKQHGSHVTAHPIHGFGPITIVYCFTSGYTLETASGTLNVKSMLRKAVNQKNLNSR